MADPITLPSYSDLDELVDTNPIELRNVAWRLCQAVNAYQDTIDRVARLQVVAHGCGGSVIRVVFAEHLFTALGLTPDGNGVA